MDRAEQWAIDHPAKAVWLQPKLGSGIGARLFVFRGDRWVGTLGFHEGGDWQATSTQEGVEWAVYAEALRLARRAFPVG